MSNFQIILTSTVIASLVSALIGVSIGWLRERDLAKFKDDLRKKAFESETRFTSLHEKRAEVIAELYSRLATTERVFRHLTSRSVILDFVLGSEGEETRHQLAGKAWVQFSSYFDTNRIYLTEELEEKVDELVEELSEVLGIAPAIPLVTPVPSPDDLEALREIYEETLDARESFISGVPQLKREIEKDFRTFLGEN